MNKLNFWFKFVIIVGNSMRKFLTWKSNIGNIKKPKIKIEIKNNTKVIEVPIPLLIFLSSR